MSKEKLEAAYRAAHRAWFLADCEYQKADGLYWMARKERGHQEARVWMAERRKAGFLRDEAWRHLQRIKALYSAPALPLPRWDRNGPPYTLWYGNTKCREFTKVAT